jgi:hypothetical protein
MIAIRKIEESRWSTFRFQGIKNGEDVYEEYHLGDSRGTILS